MAAEAASFFYPQYSALKGGANQKNILLLLKHNVL